MVDTLDLLRMIDKLAETTTYGCDTGEHPRNNCIYCASRWFMDRLASDLVAFNEMYDVESYARVFKEYIRKDARPKW